MKILYRTDGVESISLQEKIREIQRANSELSIFSRARQTFIFNSHSDPELSTLPCRRKKVNFSVY